VRRGRPPLRLHDHPRTVGAAQRDPDHTGVGRTPGDAATLDHPTDHTDRRAAADTVRERAADTTADARPLRLAERAAPRLVEGDDRAADARLVGDTGAPHRRAGGR
jgi:hypothetical protein